MTWVDNRKNSKPLNQKGKEIKYGKVRRGFSIKFLSGQMKFRAKQKEIRPEKVEEIKAVWQSPKFKTHNQRLVYLLRHCTIIEPQYGYTIREFLHAIYPQKMDTDHESTNEYDDEYYAFKAIRKMFNRFNHDVTNHEVVLSAVLAKGTGKWYYYNTIDNEQAMKDQKLRAAKMSLGYQKRMQELQDIVEHSEEIESEHKARYEEIMRKINTPDKVETNRNPLKFNSQREKGQGTLD